MVIRIIKAEHLIILSVIAASIQTAKAVLYICVQECTVQAGRFISEDPIKAGDNWYMYCNGNPLNMLILGNWHWVIHLKLLMKL